MHGRAPPRTREVRGALSAGRLRGGTPGADEVGRALAESAALEAASVRAFAQLARELAAHGAPASLVAGARWAAREEAGHARLFRRAAAERRCRVPLTRSARHGGIRSLRELAIENAVEGCGRESLGAALLQLQSLSGADPALRSMLARVASEECEHAELAWDIHAWVRPRLDAEARAQVQAAYEAFLASCEARPPRAEAAVARALGLPSACVWRALVRATRSQLRALAA
jgi:predicted metal-dependent hydrolase